MTLDQWYAHPTNRKELKAILESQVVSDALSILRQKITLPTPVPQGVDLRDFYGFLGSKKEGHYECLANLFALTRATQPKNAPVQPWDGEAQIKALPKP